MAVSDRPAVEGETSVRLLVTVDGEHRAAVECVGEVTVKVEGETVVIRLETTEG